MRSNSRCGSTSTSPIGGSSRSHTPSMLCFSPYRSFTPPEPVVIPFPPPSPSRPKSASQEILMADNRVISTVSKRNTYGGVATENNVRTVKGDKIVLKYTDGGIQRPKSPVKIFSNGLPKLYRKNHQQCWKDSLRAHVNFFSLFQPR